MAILKVVNLGASPISVGDTDGFGVCFTVPGGGYAAWKQATAYTANTSFVTCNGNIYKCKTSNTSAATGTGPSGTGTGISDSSVTWDYVSAAPSVTKTLLDRQVDSVATQLGKLVTAGTAYFTLADDPAEPDVAEAYAPTRVLTIRVPLVAGTAGTDDDVTIYTPATLPSKIRVIDTWCVVTTGVTGGTLTLRTQAGGSAGEALTDAYVATAANQLKVLRGGNASALPAATMVLQPGTHGLYIRRHDRAIAGEFYIDYMAEV